MSSFRDSAFRVLASRGPDGRGALAVSSSGFSDATAGAVLGNVDALLIHTRLAVIDVSAAGAQPMIDPAGRFALVLNGEIYNYEALRERLGLRAADMRGHSDTEVLLHWLAADGELTALTGMFAAAFIDRPRAQAWLIRDAFGIKPLFVAQRAGALAFSSELRVLLALPGIDRSVVPERVIEHLRYGGSTVATRGTLVRGIRTLLPGESMRVPLDAPDRAEIRAWHRVYDEIRFQGSFEDAVGAVREAFRDSVRLHLKSDVRVGCALSGGIDSSSILLTMRHVLGTACKLHAVSHIADAEARSEEAWIDLAATAAEATVHKVRPRAQEMLGDLDDLLMTQGEPFGGTSIYAQYRVFERARAEGLTVMLDGQGADELLAGYPHFVASRLVELLRAGCWTEAFALLRAPHTRAKASPRTLMMLLVRLGLPVSYADRLGALVGAPGMPSWVRAPEGIDYYGPQDERRRRLSRGLKAALVESLTTSLVTLLRYEDRNSMRFSVESRVPFLSREFADLLLGMPPKFFIGPEGQSKWVFRQAMRGIVPDAILDRRDKIGFENDEAAWLRAAAPWAESVLSEDSRVSPYVDSVALHRAWKQFRSGSTNLAVRLWSTLLYLRWSRLFGIGA